MEGLKKGCFAGKSRAEHALDAFRKFIPIFQHYYYHISSVIETTLFLTSLYIRLFQMDGISGVSAVLAVGGFVATTILELNKLKRNIEDAPKELLGLTWYLEQLEHSLNIASSLVHRPNLSAQRSDSVELVTKAVENCTEPLKKLELQINKFKGSRSSQNRLQKTFKSVKYALKKEEIQQIQTQLHHCIDNLSLAISLNSSHQ